MLFSRVCLPFFLEITSSFPKPSQTTAHKRCLKRSQNKKKKLPKKKEESSSERSSIGALPTSQTSLLSRPQELVGAQLVEVKTRLLDALDPEALLLPLSSSAGRGALGSVVRQQSVKGKGKVEKEQVRGKRTV